MMKYNGQKNRDKKRKQRNNRLLKSEKEEYDKRYYLTRKLLCDRLLKLSIKSKKLSMASDDF